MGVVYRADDSKLKRQVAGVSCAAQGGLADFVAAGGGERGVTPGPPRARGKSHCRHRSQLPVSRRCSTEVGGNVVPSHCNPERAAVSSSGHTGNVILAPTGGNVGVRETSPIHTLEIKFGSTTLAHEWITPSSGRFKTNIHPLERRAPEGRAAIRGGLSGQDRWEA